MNIHPPPDFWDGLKGNADLADDLYKKKKKWKTNTGSWLFKKEKRVKVKLLWLIDEHPIPDAGATISL